MKVLRFEAILKQLLHDVLPRAPAIILIALFRKRNASKKSVLDEKPYWTILFLSLDSVYERCTLLLYSQEYGICIPGELLTLFLVHNCFK